jgi:indole-3-acetate monooxygenase
MQWNGGPPFAVGPFHERRPGPATSAGPTGRRQGEAENTSLPPSGSVHALINPMSGDLAHPSQFLDGETVTTLRAYAAAAEGAKQLHERQLAIVRDRKWFKLFAPAQWRGLGLTLPQALVLEEALAWADGSTAWVITLCGGASWFAGFVDPSIRDELFAAPDSCLAGSGAASGTAEIVGDGYLIDGVWPYASGAVHATAFTANCILTRGGAPLSDSGGTKQMGTFVFKREEVALRRTWNSVGLAATGSHAFAVQQLAVPARCRFHLEARYATLSDPVYQYPFLQLAEATLAVNLSGMAVRFLELAADLVRESSGPSLVTAQAHLDAGRRTLFAVVGKTWRALEDERVIPGHALSEVGGASRQLALVAQQVVDAIYPLCGLRAADLGSEINRVWRNLHTAGQHALLRMDMD